MTTSIEIETGFFKPRGMIPMAVLRKRHGSMVRVDPNLNHAHFEVGAMDHRHNQKQFNYFEDCTMNSVVGIIDKIPETIDKINCRKYGSIGALMRRPNAPVEYADLKQSIKIKLGTILEPAINEILFYTGSVKRIDPELKLQVEKCFEKHITGKKTKLDLLAQADNYGLFGEYKSNQALDSEKGRSVKKRMDVMETVGNEMFDRHKRFFVNLTCPTKATIPNLGATLQHISEVTFGWQEFLGGFGIWFGEPEYRKLFQQIDAQIHKAFKEYMNGGA